MKVILTISLLVCFFSVRTEQEHIASHLVSEEVTFENWDYTFTCCAFTSTDVFHNNRAGYLDP